MEYRRLIKFGNSSYVISVPKDWLKKNNLEKGDMIYMHENGNNEIVVSPKIETTELEHLAYTLDVDNQTLEDIKRHIISKYVAGYDTFILTGEKTLREKQTEIRSLFNNLMALEIIEQTKSKIIAKDFLNPSEISFKVMVRRVDTILRSMLEDFKTVDQKEDSVDIVRRDSDINRLNHLTARTVRKCLQYPSLLKRLEVDVTKLLFYRELIENLERIADEIKRISRLIVATENPHQKFKEFYAIYEDTVKFYLDAMKAMYNADESLAYSLAQQRESLLERCLVAAEKSKDIYLFSAYERLKTIVVLIRNVVRLIYQGG